MKRVIFIDGKQRVYLRIPKETDEEQIVITLNFSEELAGKYFIFKELNQETEDIPVR